MVGHMKCNATALAIVSAAVAVTTTWQGQVRVESVSGLKLNLRGPGMSHMAWVTTPQILNFRSSRRSKSKANANDREKIQTTSTRHNTRVSETISKATSKLQRAGAAVVEMAQSGAGVAKQGLGMARAMRRRSNYMTSAERQEVDEKKRLELVDEMKRIDEESKLRQLNLSDADKKKFFTHRFIGQFGVSPSTAEFESYGKELTLQGMEQFFINKQNEFNAKNKELAAKAASFKKSLKDKQANELMKKMNSSSAASTASSAISSDEYARLKLAYARSYLDQATKKSLKPGYEYKPFVAYMDEINIILTKEQYDELCDKKVKELQSKIEKDSKNISAEYVQTLRALIDTDGDVDMAWKRIERKHQTGLFCTTRKSVYAWVKRLDEHMEPGVERENLLAFAVSMCATYLDIYSAYSQYLKGSNFVDLPHEKFITQADHLEKIELDTKELRYISQKYQDELKQAKAANAYAKAAVTQLQSFARGHAVRNANDLAKKASLYSSDQGELDPARQQQEQQQPGPTAPRPSPIKLTLQRVRRGLRASLAKARARGVTQRNKAMKMMGNK